MDREKLEQLALHYVSRYATTRAKLTAYLTRKVRERGWDDAEAPAIDCLVARFAELRYVDDAAYAAMRTASLTRRGYGARRVSENLRAAGIEESDREEAVQQAEQEKWQAAEAFARKRRIGTYGRETADRSVQQKQMAAFLRAGHDFELAKRFVRAEPGEIIEWEQDAGGDLSRPSRP